MIDANAAQKSSKPVIKPQFDQESYKKRPLSVERDINNWNGIGAWKGVKVPEEWVIGVCLLS